ncbi:MAG: isocitrate lyase [Thermoplasmatota archaeon]
MPNPRTESTERLQNSWDREARWKGVERLYTAQDVVRLRGTVHIEHTLAARGAEKLWKLLQGEAFVPALGALSGVQAVQMVKAGLKAIYVSGWQVAADNNLSDQTYPDQSLYPANSVPTVVRRINNALLRADQIHHLEDDHGRDWLVPLVADGEAGFGGPLNTFELTKAMVDAGAAGIHFEDQLASAKKCGHMGGKVLIPTNQHRRSLTAARLAADVLGVPTVLIARTDARGATLLASDCDPRDKPFLTGRRTIEGHYIVRSGLESAIARGLAYAPYADLLWFETDKPDLAEAEEFAKAIHRVWPGKLLAYNCSPSFHWRKHLDEVAIADFQRRIARFGYKFQFVTLAGFHALTSSMFALAGAFRERGMSAYAELQDAEFGMVPAGYSALRHQREVGTTYFDEVASTVIGREATVALKGSTEESHFQDAPATAIPVAPTTTRAIRRRTAKTE